MTDIEGIKKKDLIAFRSFHSMDEAFIYTTFLKGLRYGNSVFGFVDQEIYFRVYHQIIEHLLRKPGTTIRIACLKEDPEIILGYSISEGSTVHWIFIKQAWRQIGLMKDLLPDSFEWVSHITTVGKQILGKKYPKVRFNPFLQS
jgi:hypothetical protein